MLNGVEYTIASVADTDQRNPYQGTIYVRLVNIADRKFGQLEIMDFVRKNVLPKPDTSADNLRISVTPVSFMSGGGMSAASVQYMIGGPDIQKLEQYAKAVMADLRKCPARWTSIRRSRRASRNTASRPTGPRRPNWASRSPTSPIRCGCLVAGDKVSDYTDQGEQYEVHVRSIADVRNRLDELKMITVPSSKFGTVPLDDVVRFDPGTGPAQINRLGRTRQVTISANLTPGTSEQGVLDAIDARHEKVEHGAGIQDGPAGQIEGNGQGVSRRFSGPSSWPSSSSISASPPSSSRGSTRSRSCFRCR